MLFKGPTAFAPFCQPSTNLGSALSDIWWFGYNNNALVLGQHNTGNAVTAAWNPSLDVWYHVAVTRASGSVRLFLNGTQIGITSTLYSGTSFSQNGFAVGAITTPVYFNDNMNDFRFYNGFAKYTANFTPE